MNTPEQIMSIVGKQVASLDSGIKSVVDLIHRLEDDLITQYNAGHTEPHSGFCDEDTDETCCLSTLGCITSELSDAQDCITKAMELLGLV